jgi:hypothetical protein
MQDKKKEPICWDAVGKHHACKHACMMQMQKGTWEKKIRGQTGLHCSGTEEHSSAPAAVWNLV